MSIHTHIAIETSPGFLWVYQVPTAYAGTRDDILKHGVLVAACYEGVWQIDATSVIRDARYREILENTPVLKEIKS